MPLGSRILFWLSNSKFITEVCIILYLLIGLKTSDSLTDFFKCKSETLLPKISISLLKYFVNEKETSIDNLEIILRDEIGNKEGLVVLHCDKDVPVEHLVNVAGIATSLEAKVTIAAKPKK